MNRPYLSKVHTWYWKDQHGNSTPGVILRRGDKIVAHLKPEEALELSNRLVDLTEELEGRHDPAQ